MVVVPVTDVDDPRLEPYRHITQFNHLEHSGIFIAEGWRVVWRMLVSDINVDSILISERRWEGLKTSLMELRTWENSSSPVYIIPQEMGERLVGFNFHAGVLGCGRRPPRQNLMDIFCRLESNDSARILVCPRITSPENLGTAIRNAAGLGFDAILLGRGSVDPYSRRVVRVSMGNIFQFPVFLVNDLKRLVDSFNPAVWKKLGLELTPDAVDLRSISLPTHLMLFIGNEADGLENDWLERCSHKIFIPIKQGVDSLNASTAAAIAMYELAKR